MKTKLLFLMLFAFSAFKMQAQCPATFTYTISPNGTVAFAATGNLPPSTLYFWEFGDGNTGYGASITHTYPATGNYNACLYVNDTLGGCTDSSCQTVTITNIGGGCQASFYIYEDSLNVGSHTYIGVNTSQYNAGTTFNWSWGDGTYATGFNPPSHTYPAAGVYNICLVISGGGCTDTFCSNETINKTAANMYSVTFGASPTGIKEVSAASKIQVYPNPAHDYLFIKGEKGSVYQFEIYNINGSKVDSGKVKADEAIHISALSGNLYLMKLTDSKGNQQFTKFSK